MIYTVARLREFLKEFDGRAKVAVVLVDDPDNELPLECIHRRQGRRGNPGAVRFVAGRRTEILDEKGTQ